MKTGVRHLGLLAAAVLLTSCQDHVAPTENSLVVPGPLLAQVQDGPVVNSLADPGDGICDDTECTLREAVAFADPGATITFSVTGTIGLTDGQILIAKDLTIEGPGVPQLTVARIGCQSCSDPGFRVFAVGQVTAALSGMKITNGLSTELGTQGGGVYNTGTLTLHAVEISGNAVPFSPGGGIGNVGTMTLSSSLVSGNRSLACGGITNRGSLTIINSTVAANDAFSVGGICTGNPDGTGTLLLISSTVSDNQSSFETNGAGIFGPVTAKSSIIAGNYIVPRTLLQTLNCSNGAATDGGYNISDDATCGFNTDNNSRASTDPKLGVLQENGGPTRTFALQPGSPALDAIPLGANGCGTTVTTDQRGTSRPLPVGNKCDMGAFEFAPADITPPTITITTPIDGATYLLRQVVSADYTCQDESGGSGLALCTSTAAAPGEAIPTGTLGTHVFEVVAMDVTGNRSTKAATYSVAYDFSGFAAPVSGGGVLNVAKAGKTIPLKWRLLDGLGNPVPLPGVTVTVEALACDAGSSVDEVGEYAAGTSGLQDLGDGYYQFNWVTPKSYANSCKTLLLDLGEGITRTALFQFVK
jgi:CSLREA domain-containing protein